MAVMEMVNESPSESVGAAKLSSSSSIDIFADVNEIEISEPAIRNALLEGSYWESNRCCLPPPPPPQAATINAIKLADSNFGFFN